MTTMLNERLQGTGPFGSDPPENIERLVLRLLHESTKSGRPERTVAWEAAAALITLQAKLREGNK